MAGVNRVAMGAARPVVSAYSKGTLAHQGAVKAVVSGWRNPVSPVRMPRVRVRPSR